jgi:serine/threonine protein phosphatase PrpC
MHIESAACTHVGRRPNNEDSHLVDPELGLYVVADGRGGYEGGEVASRLVIESLQTFFARNVEDGDATWPTGVDPTLSFEENLLRARVEQSHREVIHRNKGRLAHMGAHRQLVLRVARTRAQT